MPSIQERLEYVRSNIQIAGFDSIAEPMVALLNHTADDSERDNNRNVESFFEGQGLNDLCNAIVKHPRYRKCREALRQGEGVQEFATSITCETVVQELQVLSRTPDMHIPLSGSAQSKIDDFSFDKLDRTHQAAAPVLRSLLMAVVSPRRGSSETTDPSLEVRAKDISNSKSSVDTDPAAESISTGTQQRATQDEGRNRQLIATSALSMLAYAHSEDSNLFQVIMGYYAFTSGFKKRSMEAFHQIGCMVTYESVTGVLRANALAIETLLREKAQTERFLLSFDKLNFYRHKRVQALHHSGNPENYTAGFVTFVGRGPQLSRESIDRTMVNDLVTRDVLLDSVTVRCHQEAARASACQILSKYLSSAFGTQTMRDDAGKLIPKYLMWDPPLMSERCSLEKANILPLPILATIKPLVLETITILQEYADVLGLWSHDLADHRLIINGDFMTVRNITQASFLRRDQYRENTLDWVEPVIDFFHIQKTALKMMYNVFWGQPDEIVGLCTFANLLPRKNIEKEAADFDNCNRFFLLLAEAFWLALIASECGCQTWEDLEAYVAKENWHATIDRIASAYIDPYAVGRIKNIAEKKVRCGTKAEIDELRIEDARMAAKGQTDRHPTYYWVERETELFESRLPHERDEVRENALLFLSNGLLYREFNDACRGGYSGRAFKCLEQYTVMFHGSRNTNYARGCLNICAHMKHGWKPEFMDFFSRFCLVNPTGFKGRFHALDRFNEYEIRELKAMMHVPSNPQSNKSFRRDIAFNFTSLASVKAKVQQATRSTVYEDQHQAVVDATDLRTVFDALMNGSVFRETRGRKASKEFVDLVARGSRELATDMPIQKYLKHARGNWGRVGDGKDLNFGSGSFEEDIDADDWQGNQQLVSNED